MSSRPSEQEETPWFRSWWSMGVRAWSMLKSSESIAPKLVSEDGLRFGLPWMRIWDDAMGFGFDIEPFTLTVFDPFDVENQPLVRKAVWQRTNDLRRLHTLVEERHGAVSFEPAITITDATVSGCELQTILRSGLDLRVPLVRLSNKGSVTTDVGSVGFEFFTLDQPQAKVGLEWSFDPPSEWQPAIEFATQLRAFLESCLGRSTS